MIRWWRRRIRRRRVRGIERLLKNLETAAGKKSPVFLECIKCRMEKIALWPFWTDRNDWYLLPKEATAQKGTLHVRGQYRVVCPSINERTPLICSTADGLIIEAGHDLFPPHDTGSPKILCSCYTVRAKPNIAIVRKDGHINYEATVEIDRKEAERLFGPLTVPGRKESR